MASRDKSINKASADFSEIGRHGLANFGGRIYDEFLRELQGPKAAKVYREMRDNDPVVGAIIFAIEQILRSVSWRVEPNDLAPDSQEDADFISECLDDMSFTWQDTVAEIFSFLTYGWSFFELVYKKREGPLSSPASAFNDGKIGWRKWGIRVQESLWEWKFDEEGGVQAMVQQAPTAQGGFAYATIPIEKALLFRTQPARGNPEGRSVLRNAYRPWYFKRRIEEIEAIGIERDLAGLPVLTTPEHMDIWNDSKPDAVTKRKEAEKLVRSIRRDQQEGILKPFGWELELLSSGGKRNFDTTQVITRYDQRIAMTMLADFILLGHEVVGSFALSEDKTKLFRFSLGGFLDAMIAVINRHAIPRLLLLNGRPADNAPKLTRSSVDHVDLAEIGAFIQQMTSAGAVMFPDDTLEQHLRGLAKLPAPDRLGPDEAEVEMRKRDESIEHLIEVLKQRREPVTAVAKESVERQPLVVHVTNPPVNITTPPVNVHVEPASVHPHVHLSDRMAEDIKNAMAEGTKDIKQAVSEGVAEVVEEVPVAMAQTVRGISGVLEEVSKVIKAIPGSVAQVLKRQPAPQVTVLPTPVTVKPADVIVQPAPTAPVRKRRLKIIRDAQGRMAELREED